MRHLKGLAFLSIFGIATSTTVFGAGFALVEQSVPNLGSAFSGGAAAEDASTVFFNPAGMTLLPGTQAAGALHFVVPAATFHSKQATNVLGGSLGSDSGGNAGKAGYVPNLYATSNFGRVAVGFGINAPFGLATDYNQKWVGRYHAVKSVLRTININPAVAVQIADRLSLGAGVSAQYLDVQLTNMVDFGLSAFTASGGNPALLPTVSNPNADVYADLNADSWGIGWNLGALLSYADGGRLGLAYRSRVEHKLKGDADFTTVNPAFLGLFGLSGAAAASFPDQGVSGDVTLPATASLNLYQQLTPAWAVTADVTWTEWSTFDKLVIQFDRGVGAGLASKQSVTTENWQDSWRYALGSTLRVSEVFTVRGGVAYDETPIEGATYRTPRIPDEDRFWLACGAGYQLSEHLALDVGYAHLFVRDAEMNKVDTATGENRGRGTVVGEFDNHVDILSAQLTAKF